MTFDNSINYTGTLFRDCIMTTHNFFSTQYTNICDGSVHLVANGTMDMVGNGLAIAGFAMLVSMLILAAVGAVLET